MKKTILSLFALAFLFTLNIDAQETTAPVYKNPVWGIKGNLNAELPSRVREDGTSHKFFNSGFGASIGGVMNLYLDKNFYFEPEVALFYEGYSYNNVKAVAPNSPSVNVGPNIYKLGVRIPVDFGYFINISEKWGLNIFTGPVFNYAFYGKAKSTHEATMNDDDLMSVFGGKYPQNRVDLAWKVGVGFPVDHFMISLEADFGITDMMKGPGTFRENTLGLGITYYFANPATTE